MIEVSSWPRVHAESESHRVTETHIRYIDQLDLDASSGRTDGAVGRIVDRHDFHCCAAILGLAVSATQMSTSVQVD